jgi:YVTN family beta-propeller protein
VLELDAHTLRTTREYDIGGVVHEIVPSPDGLTLYVTNEAGWLDELHVASGQRASLHFDAMPHGLALSPDGAVLYVGLLHAGEVAVLDRQTLRQVSTIPTGGKPRRIAFDAAGRRAIIANENGWVDLVT